MRQLTYYRQTGSSGSVLADRASYSAKAVRRVQIRARKLPKPPMNHNPYELLRQVAGAATTEPSIAIARQQPVQRIAPALRNHPRRIT
jgi:hypothetical protein